MSAPRHVSVVLSGGGMRGLAHVGVLKVLARHGIVPDSYIGSSVGSLIAGMAAGGMMPEDIQGVALSLRRRDLLDFDWLGLLFRQGRNRSLYRGRALHDLVRRVLPEDSFERLLKPLYVHTVDAYTADELVWGLPGFTEVPVHDAVVASCSIPGVFPPKRIGRHWLVDGCQMDPLPVKVAVHQRATLIIAVYLDSLQKPPADQRGREGMISFLDRGQTLLTRTVMNQNLRLFSDAPLVLIEPRVDTFGLFQFNSLEEVVLAGELAAERAVAHHPLLAEYAHPVEATPLPSTLPLLNMDSGRTDKGRGHGSAGETSDAGPQVAPGGLAN